MGNRRRPRKASPRRRDHRGPVTDWRRQIGQGGIGGGVRARDLELEEDVALKVFTLRTTSETAIARFKQELKLSRQLVHPNIIRLYDIGMPRRIATSAWSSSAAKASRTRMRPAHAVPGSGSITWCRPCRGLQAAHDAGVIHRDVKPTTSSSPKAACSR